MASRYLTTPCTSAESERLFSTAGDIVTDKRRCALHHILFIRDRGAWTLSHPCRPNDEPGLATTAAANAMTTSGSPTPHRVFPRRRASSLITEQSKQSRNNGPPGPGHAPSLTCGYAKAETGTRGHPSPRQCLSSVWLEPKKLQTD
ncbi:hypothetical protein EVAR_74938_1 [Eumeta japonica]|uniref:HAT C-terminal dimerisation domain-containing protein n=1 Tax=Eumeta variegata TaxID=151549 RepID=A0A4C1UJN7_EUMVA|nr:hypothetical protein EVAR_74938_1 [Eumeta japonica]